MNNIDSRIFKIMSLIFRTTLESLDQNSSMDNIENWDSLAHMNLILALEEEFLISYPDEEVGNLTSFKLIKFVTSELLAS